MKHVLRAIDKRTGEPRHEAVFELTPMEMLSRPNPIDAAAAALMARVVAQDVPFHSVTYELDGVPLTPAAELWLWGIYRDELARRFRVSDHLRRDDASREES